jgi:hypothetical protein
VVLLGHGECETRFCARWWWCFRGLERPRDVRCGVVLFELAGEGFGAGGVRLVLLGPAANTVLPRPASPIAIILLQASAAAIAVSALRTWLIFPEPT